MVTLFDIGPDCLYYCSQYLELLDRFKLAGVDRYCYSVFGLDRYIFSRSDTEYIIKYWSDNLIKYYRDNNANYLKSAIELGQKSFKDLSEKEKKHLKFVLINHVQLHRMQKNLNDNNKVQRSNSTSLSTIPQELESIFVPLNKEYFGRAGCLWMSDILLCMPTSVSNAKKIFLQGRVVHIVMCTYIRTYIYNALDDECVYLLYQAIAKRRTSLGLDGLWLSDNPGITDKYMELLLNALGEKCSDLRWLALSRTSVTNKTCEYIYNMFQNYFHRTNARYYQRDIIKNLDMGFIKTPDLLYPNVFLSRGIGLKDLDGIFFFFF
ncbi:hypothetical protein RFI_29736 [Reticulomyxa filosa]|uniref:Uncharacterized protein n=1 Tax=Reticulomyxa filosa TaxID=46433 RepID=X6M3Q3_RETFI|nr:hypothetical protein RFI_29736 [Reticulomyxa filosa]|eukprot:ETO07655.1 hypothetical protein RFI_29736 [Reticulomyxa filosa]